MPSSKRQHLELAITTATMTATTTPSSSAHEVTRLHLYTHNLSFFQVQHPLLSVVPCTTSDVIFQEVLFICFQISLITCRIASATRAAPNFSLHLPEGWKGTNDTNGISEGDRHWIGKALFASKGTQSTIQLWYHPPPSLGVPNPGAYHRRPLFLWMLKRMWGIAFTCPRCAAPNPLR